LRKLMYFTIGFCMACGLCVWLLPGRGILPGMVIIAELWFAAWICRRNPLVHRAVFLLAGLAAGLAWFSLFQGHYLQNAVNLDGLERQLTVEVSDYGYETGYGIGAEGWITLEGKPYRIRIYMNGDTPLSPGDRVEGIFQLRITTLGADDRKTHHSGNGVFLLGYQRQPMTVTPAGSVRWRYYPALLAHRITGILENTFPEDTVAFAKALLLGDSYDLDYETDTALKLSGIRHVVAVSGLHVSILFALISTITFHRRFVTALVGFPVLFLFAALAGFTPSVNRACLMTGLMLFGKLVNREYDGATALSFAVLIMLLGNPLAVTSIGLQLSAASVAGIFLFYESIYGWLQKKLEGVKPTWKKPLNWGAASVAVTLSATVMTTPLSALYFGTVSLVGIVTNLLTLWVVSFIFYGIMAVCVVNLLWHGGAVLLAELISLPIRYVLLCARVLGAFPLAAVYTRSVYIVFWLVGLYCLLVVFLLRGRKDVALFGFSAVLGLCLALLVSWIGPFTGEVQMTVLDVGQGQSILLQCEGKSFLIDCGGDNDEQTADAVAETLLSQGIGRLDGVILTHMDRDHAGGLEYLLTRIHTQLLIVPRSQEEKPLPEISGQILRIEEEAMLELEKSTIRIFGGLSMLSGNENSLCILFESENCAILITGDRSILGEQLLMRRVQLPDVDVLVAGHHGSRDSTGEGLLQAVRPETVIISVGETNIYGHPDPALLQRLEEHGCTVYRTDLAGTIYYRR